MNLKFWMGREKKEAKEPFVPRVFTLEGEDAREVFALIDRYHESAESKVAEYDLWANITGRFPEIKEGRWSINYIRRMTVRVEEKAPA